MAVVKNWWLAAAREVVDELRGDYPGEREDWEAQIVAILQKHCPFKPDTAYEEIGSQLNEEREP